jgi:replicative DNA helicase
VLQLVQQKHGNQIADLRDAADALKAAYAAHFKLGPQGLMLGWPYLDKMTGGLNKGDVVSYVGRPGLGKTWQMLYGAYYGWAKADADQTDPVGSSRMFVSMEMNVLTIEQRLAAIHTKLPHGHIIKAQLTQPKGLNAYKAGIKEWKGYKAPFWVVDGNLTATVEDIMIIARQLKPDAIFIDGAYLLQNQKAKDRYARVAENMDLIKRELASVAPTVCSWQFKRSESKKTKNKDDADLEDIGYSDAIGQHSSLVLGLFEDDNVETLKTRKVKVLKGRNGETGEFKTKWLFDKMDFSEFEPVTLESLQFID